MLPFFSAASHDRFFCKAVFAFFGLFFTTHYVSLCSVTAYLSAFVLVILFGQMGSYGMDKAHMTELYLVMAALTALALFKHRTNIQRLFKGTESKVYLGKKAKKE